MRQGTHWEAPGTPLVGEEAHTRLLELRALAEEHRYVRIPHPKAALILALIDKGMLQVRSVPGTGLVLRATGAKEEFSRILRDLNAIYRFVNLTWPTLILS